MRFLASAVVVAVVSGCGVGATTSPGLSTGQALTGTAEQLEFEPKVVRTRLFRDVVKQGQLQAGRADTTALFPMLVDGALVGAPALEGRVDLLGGQDAGAPHLLQFGSLGERFSEDRRDAYQGLSEREAAELIARALLARWGVTTAAAIPVVRAPGAPYAAAYLDGVLRLNPAFVYMAAAVEP